MCMSNEDLIEKLDKLLQDVRQYESESSQLIEIKQRIEQLENSGKEKLKKFWWRVSAKVYKRTYWWKTKKIFTI